MFERSPHELSLLILAGLLLALLGLLDQGGEAAAFIHNLPAVVAC